MNAFSLVAVVAAAAGALLAPTSTAFARTHHRRPPQPGPVVGPVTAPPVRHHHPRPPQALPFIAIAYWTVRPGDTLWALAVRFDGDGYAWRDLAAMNRVNPRLLQIGSRLTIVAETDR